MVTEFNRKIILEDGSEYCGLAFGDTADKVCEIVFNTSMVGYQEIISDPSYTDQAVVMTYPLIGNYGMADEDYETITPTIGGLIVREYNDLPSNFRSKATLSEVMEKYKIAGIYGVDTRKLTRSIRDHGSRKVLITDISTTKEEGVRILSETILPTDAVSRVSCGKIWASLASGTAGASETSEKSAASGNAGDLVGGYHVVAIDCGMKTNIVRSLNQRGCRVTIVPWNTSAREIESLCPDGIFISNGPGDPTDVQPAIDTVKALLGKYPMFGICLGHQIISLAYGARTYKLKFGHRGGNHPVRNLETGKIEITSQNHSYAVDMDSVAATPLTVTHVNILDNTVEGMKCERDKVFSVQYHPESAPGPQDSAYLFDRFIKMMEEEKKNA